MVPEIKPLFDFKELGQSKKKEVLDWKWIGHLTLKRDSVLQVLPSFCVQVIRGGKSDLKHKALQ